MSSNYYQQAYNIMPPNTHLYDVDAGVSSTLFGEVPSSHTPVRHDSIHDIEAPKPVHRSRSRSQSGSNSQRRRERSDRNPRPQHKRSRTGIATERFPVKVHNTTLGTNVLQPKTKARPQLKVHTAIQIPQPVFAQQTDPNPYQPQYGNVDAPSYYPTELPMSFDGLRYADPESPLHYSGGVPTQLSYLNHGRQVSDELLLQVAQEEQGGWPRKMEREMRQASDLGHRARGEKGRGRRTERMEYTRQDRVRGEKGWVGIDGDAEERRRKRDRGREVRCCIVM